MSDLFVYICTRQTADPYVPKQARDLVTFSRDVSDAFYALQGGRQTVGKLALFPLQKAQPDHLLCDGKEVPKASFPELYEYLGDFMGTPVDPDNFVLPDYINAPLAGAASAAAETVEGGTVTSEPSSPGGGDSGGSIEPAVDSGGRVKKPIPQ